jgi:hypothetical protein
MVAPSTYVRRRDTAMRHLLAGRRLTGALPTLVAALPTVPYGSISGVRRDDSNDRDVIEGNREARALIVPYVATADIETCVPDAPSGTQV